MSPHCAASVAAAPAIITIAIDVSDPRGASPSRSITKKPRLVSTAACACPATTPEMIQLLDAGVIPLQPLSSRGAVDATTLAPVVEEASEG